MASCIRRVLANRKCTSTRGLCSRNPVEHLHSHVQQLTESLSPSIVSLAISFPGSVDPETHHSCGRRSGVFLDPSLIVTSANAMGRVSTVYESRTLEKPDRFDHGYVFYKAYIGSIAAHTSCGKVMKMRPLAVNFADDVAVLEVLNPEGTSLPHCTLANSPPDKGDILMAIAEDGDLHLGNVRTPREKSVRAKAPWPMDDDLGWIEHEWFFFGGGNTLPQSILISSREKVIGSTTKISGSPWFNLDGEVVGISSWEVVDEPTEFSVGFAVPHQCIRSVLDYAKTKGPDDPIVMDRWVGACMIHEH